MIVEGIGKKAPTPVTVIVARHEMLVILQEAQRQSDHRGYARGGTWAQGLKGDVVIENVGLITRAVRPAFCGNLGEYAACCHINRKFGIEVAACDFILRKFGDGGIDLKVFGLTLQVKTRESNRHGNLIRRIDDRGKVLEFSAQAFVFCEWGGFDSVQLLGWEWTKAIENREVVPAIVGDHQNIVVEDEDLQPMNRLVDNLEARREAGRCSK
jgi:hypothetical protein